MLNMSKNEGLLQYFILPGGVQLEVFLTAVRGLGLAGTPAMLDFCGPVAGLDVDFVTDFVSGKNAKNNGLGCYRVSSPSLTLLPSQQPKLRRVLAVLGAIGLSSHCCVQILTEEQQQCSRPIQGLQD